MLSVIIPFFREYAFVEQAVDSALSQGIGNIEIIIVDDECTQRSREFLENRSLGPNVKFVHHDENKGLSASRNTGIEHAQGDWIAFLDGDDFYLHKGLARQFDLARVSGADLTHAATLLRERGRGGELIHKMLSRDETLFAGGFDASTLAQRPELQFIVSSWSSIYRRDHLERHRLRFDEAQRKFEDRLFVLENVFSGATIASLNEPIRAWRRRAGTITTANRSPSDIQMMANLVDKCTALVEREAPADNGLYLEREVFHSTCRIVHNTRLIDYLSRDDELAASIRPVLQAALSRAPLSKSTLDDPLCRVVSVAGSRNPAGHVISGDDILKAHQLIVGAAWQELAKSPLVVPEGFTKSPASVRRSRPVPADPKVDDVRFVFHAGLHKTGTTHIQRTLETHRETLKDQGVLFPGTGYVSSSAVTSRLHATPGHQMLLQAAIVDDRSLLKTLEEEILRSNCHTVLISFENLAFPYMSGEDRVGRISEVRDFFSLFRQREVAVVLRRPDEYFEALYRERVSNVSLKEARTADNFLETQGGSILNFAEVLHALEAFADGNLHLAHYQDLISSGDYVNAFLARLGIKATLPESNNARTYASLSREETETLRLLNLLMPVGARKSNVARDVIASLRKTETATNTGSALSPETRIDILERVRTDAAQVLSVHGLDLPFDEWIKALDAEKQSWQPMSGLSASAVATLTASVTAVEAHPDLAISGAKPAGIRTRIADNLARSRLRELYLRSPSGMKSIVRRIYFAMRRP